MINLNLIPECSNYESFLEEIFKTFIRINKYQNRVKKNKDYLINEGKTYKTYAKSNDLYKLSRTSINSSLEDKDISKLYTNYFVSKTNNLYDRIKVNSRDIGCPYCGGIGYIDQIDHFLPQSQYDRFAVFPYNLIPSCVKCNEIHKKTFFPRDKKKQIIHPYLDTPFIFNEQWIFGKYENNSIEYYVSPPSSWSIDIQEKVKLHFETFGLKDVFGIKAISRLSDIISQIKSHKENEGTIDFFKQVNLDPIINNHSNPNDWEKILYQTVKQNLLTIWNNI